MPEELNKAGNPFAAMAKEKDAKKDKKAKEKKAKDKKEKKLRKSQGAEPVPAGATTSSPLQAARVKLQQLLKAGTAGTEVPADPASGGGGMRGHQVVQAPQDPAYHGERGTQIIGHPGVSDQGVAAEQHAFGQNEFDQSGAHGEAMPETSAAGVMAGAAERIAASTGRGRSPGATSTVGLARDGFRKSDQYQAISAAEVYQQMAELGDGFSDLVEASSALGHLTDVTVGYGDNLGKGLALMDKRTKSLRKSLAKLAKAQGQQNALIAEQNDLLKAYGPAMLGLTERMAAEDDMQKSLSLGGGVPLLRPTSWQSQINNIRQVQPGIAIVQPTGTGGGTSGGKGMPPNIGKVQFVEGLQKANMAGLIGRDIATALGMRADTTDLALLWDQLPESAQKLIVAA